MPGQAIKIRLEAAKRTPAPNENSCGIRKESRAKAAGRRLTEKAKCEKPTKKEIDSLRKEAWGMGEIGKVNEYKRRDERGEGESGRKVDGDVRDGNRKMLIYIGRADKVVDRLRLNVRCRRV